MLIAFMERGRERRHVAPGVKRVIG